MSDFQSATLMSLCIPGSHDSFASKFKMFDKNDSNVPRIFNPIVKAWTKTQSTTITEQLNMGVRYFDMRICVHNDTFYTIHSLFAQRVSDIIEEIKVFCIDHPLEKILLDFNHFYMSDNDILAFEEWISSTLGNLLVNNEMENLFMPLSIINGSVYVFSRNFIKSLFSSKCFNSIWHDTNDINELCDKVESEVNVNKINVSQVILTPRIKDIVKGLLLPCVYPTSLKSMTIRNYDAIINVIRKSIVNKNVVLVDFINEEICDECIEENKRRFALCEY